MTLVVKVLETYETQKYKFTYYLQLLSYGDADMINIYNQSGEFIEPLSATRPPVGKEIYNSLKSINCKVLFLSVVSSIPILFGLINFYLLMLTQMVGGLRKNINF